MRKHVVLAVASTAAAVVVLAAIVRRWKLRKERQWKKTQRILRKFARDCATPAPRLWQIADALVHDMEASLAISSNGTGTSSLNLQVSHVDFLPTGYSPNIPSYLASYLWSLSWEKWLCMSLICFIFFMWFWCGREEQGLYYGVNLRGSNFLILCARLGGKNDPISDIHREEISIPSNVMDGTTQVYIYIYPLDLEFHQISWSLCLNLGPNSMRIIYKFLTSIICGLSATQ